MAESKSKPKRKPAAKPKTAKTPKAKPRTKSKSASSAKRKPAGTAKRTAITAAKPKTGATRRKHASRAPKPVGLECSYSGKVFRSRLEARWALYLDLLAIDWDYEPCHYRLSETLFYLPDFYLPEQRIWLEVKGGPFFDAESFAKVVNGVAGKNPVPTRNAPYEGTRTILMGGTFQPLKNCAPHHIAVAKASNGEAAFQECAWIATDSGWELAMGKTIMKSKATGSKASRRPVPAKVKAILEPPLREGSAHERVQHAYRSASKATFDDKTKSLLPPPEDLAYLQNRRAGRFLPNGL